MRKIYMGLIASTAIILTVYSTIPVYSATIDKIFYNSWTAEVLSAGYNYQQYYLFDPSLGTLNSVEMTIDTTLSNINPEGAEVLVRSDFFMAVVIGFITPRPCPKELIIDHGPMLMILWKNMLRTLTHFSARKYIG